MSITTPRLLVAYATQGSEGQTVQIAERLAAVLRESAALADVVDCEKLPSDFRLSSYDGAIIGGSVHGGRYRRSLRRLLRGQRASLESLPWAFFSVCLAIASTREDSRAVAGKLPHQLLAREGLAPREVAVFAGALRFSRHSRLGARILFRMNRGYLGRTEMEGDWEYTDWDEVDAFARRFLVSVTADVRAAAPQSS